MKSTSARFAMAALLMAGAALLLHARSQNEVVPQRQALTSLPAQFGDWQGRDDAIDKETLEVLGPGEFLSRVYWSPTEQKPWIGLFIAYFVSQRASETLHSPNHCLPGAGWVPTNRAVVQIVAPDGTSSPANRYVVAKGGERLLVLYWYQAHGREVASEYWSKYYLIADSIRMNRSDGALIRFVTPMLEGETAESAQARVMSMVSQVKPVLNSYIPL